METRRICLLGGDARMHHAAEALRRDGHTVTELGGGCAPRQALGRKDLLGALADAEVLVLPIVFDAAECSVEGAVVSSETLLEAFGGELLLCGRTAPWIDAWANRRAVSMIRYTEKELFALRNALPSAEGAIYTAMRAFPRVLAGATAVVLGYGRIGALLSDRLSHLGVRVTVCARRPEVLETARLQGHPILPIDLAAWNRGELPTPLCKCDLLFNTVPNRLLGRGALAALSPKTLLIELASFPGGFDPLDAELVERRYELARGLPGQYAPVTAGEILAVTAEELIESFFAGKQGMGGIQ